MRLLSWFAMVFLSCGLVFAEAEADDDPMEQFAQNILKGMEAENKQNYRKAIDLYTAALEIQAESPVAMIRRGICHAKLEQNQQAADDLWAAIHFHPKTISDFATLAWLRATSPIDRFRDGSLAVTYAQKALRESETAEHYDLLAAGYAEMGNFPKARTTILKAIKYFPDSPRLTEMKKRLELYQNKKPYRENWTPAEDSEFAQDDAVELRSGAPANIR